MNCEESLRHLQGSLDGTPLPEEAAAHVARCDACADRAEALRAVHEALLEEPALAWTPELTRAVADRLRAENARGRAWGAAAAVLLLAVGLAGWLLAADLPAPPGTATGVALPHSVGEAFAAVSDGCAALAGAVARLPAESPVALSAPLGLAGLLLLVLVNLLVIGRLRPARRRT